MGQAIRTRVQLTISQVLAFVSQRRRVGRPFDLRLEGFVNT